MRKIVFTLLAFLAVGASPSLAQTFTAAPAAELRIGGAVQTPLTLTAADLKKMPRKTLIVTNPHSQKKETYEGVSLEDLLKKQA